MEMRNLRQRFGAFVFAGVLAGVLGSSIPAYADIGGTKRNTCAFIAGLIFKVPADSTAADVFRAMLISYDCD
jgi:hypothetical protein